MATDPRFLAFLQRETEFETAAAVVSFNECFNAAMNHTRQRCCPPYWASPGWFDFEPTSTHRYTWSLGTPFAAPVGPYLQDGLPFNDYSAAFLYCAGRRGLRPTVELKLSAFSKVRVFPLGGVCLAGDGRGYIKGVLDPKYVAMSPEAAATPLPAVLFDSSRKGGVQTPHPINARDLLKAAHYLLNQASALVSKVMG
jgi:hypothetical protein